jgi:hypothetical protein
MTLTERSTAAVIDGMIRLPILPLWKYDGKIGMVARSFEIADADYTLKIIFACRSS